MRQIKFRGQRIDNEEWVYGFLYQLPLPTGFGCMILTTDNIHEDNSIEPEYHLAFTLWVDLFPVKPETVGQFIGVKDKNGNEIYEGDIIKSSDYPFMNDGKTNYLGIVSCDTDDAIGEFYVMLYVTKESKMRGFSNFTQKLFCDLQTEVEVVGNIFDNKGMFRDGDDEIMLWYLKD